MFLFIRNFFDENEIFMGVGSPLWGIVILQIKKTADREIKNKGKLFSSSQPNGSFTTLHIEDDLTREVIHYFTIHGILMKKIDKLTQCSMFESRIEMIFEPNFSVLIIILLTWTSPKEQLV